MRVNAVADLWVATPGWLEETWMVTDSAGSPTGGLVPIEGAPMSVPRVSGWDQPSNAQRRVCAKRSAIGANAVADGIDTQPEPVRHPGQAHTNRLRQERIVKGTLYSSHTDDASWPGFAFREVA